MKGFDMIGIMSDSHDNRTAIQQAVSIFNNSQCSLVIHAGDFVAPFAAAELGNLQCPIKCVFGNCDGEKSGLTKTIQPYGEINEAPFLFVFNQVKFLLTHIHFRAEEYAGKYNPDILIYGHTHKAEIHLKDDVLFINPGETGGWVTGKSTVALLDLSSKQAEIIPI